MGSDKESQIGIESMTVANAVAVGDAEFLPGPEASRERTTRLSDF